MKKPKKVRGMTLVEVMVALAIFTIISALLASACAGICTIMRKTERLNRKISNEAPVAEIKNGVLDATEADIVFNIGGDNYTVKGNIYKATDAYNNYEDAGDFKYFDDITINPPASP